LSERAIFLKAIYDYSIYGALFGLLALVMLYFICAGSFMHQGTPVWFAFTASSLVCTRPLGEDF